MDVQQRYTYWKEQVSEPELVDEISRLTWENDSELIEDAFFQELSFGTAGLRGVIGVGTNRMNIYTVGRATQGFADYLLSNAPEGENPSVCIARDNRNKGEEFVRYAASVLAANGIVVYVFPRIEPTPLLSFAVRDLHCSGGICMTASHNPAEYNGYKVYDEHGCQITSEAAQAISDAIDSLNYFEGIKTCDFDSAIADGTIHWIGDNVIDRYIDAVHKAGVDDTNTRDVDIRIAYTPLHGTGLECMKRIFDDMNIDAFYVEGQLEPDGNFPTCPYPNPETKEALEQGIQFAQEHNCDLVLATDPDADRVGVAVKEGDDYVLLTGNEMGILMLHYLCTMHKEMNTLPDNPLAISTIVSTAMIDAIGSDYGVEIRRVLTGFKYIGEIITSLEQSGEENRFLLGFEESYGYLTGSHARDKDAINAGLVICQMARYYKALGKTLASAIEELYKTYGYYANRTINVAFPGSQGAKKMEELMRSLRTAPPQSFAGRSVENTIDYDTDELGLPRANVIEFGMGEGVKVIFRPSGTEPKVKAYLFGKASSEEEVTQLLDALEADARACLA